MWREKANRARVVRHDKIDLVRGLGNESFCIARPLDEGDGVTAAELFLQCERGELRRVVDAVEIDVEDLFDGAVNSGVTVDECERRAAHGLVKSQHLRHAAHKGGLATAKVAVEKNNLPTTKAHSEVSGELFCFLFGIGRMCHT
mgnify:FL=1